MFLSESFWRKLVATALAAVGFVLLYDATVIDSRRAASDAAMAAANDEKTPPQAGARLKFIATAYCKGQTTASGVGGAAGVPAAAGSVFASAAVRPVMSSFTPIL